MTWTVLPFQWTGNNRRLRDSICTVCGGAARVPGTHTALHLCAKHWIAHMEARRKRAYGRKKVKDERKGQCHARRETATTAHQRRATGRKLP